MQSEAGKGSRQRKPCKDKAEEIARNWEAFEQARLAKIAKEKQSESNKS